MSKRFYDTGIFRKPWFRMLTPEQKTAWFFILSECDNVGVWILDSQAAEFFIGREVDWTGLVDSCNGNIEILPNGKWWVRDFCKFQHGDIATRRDSPVVRSYLSLLREHGLEQRVAEQLSNSCQTVKGTGTGTGTGKGIRTGGGGAFDAFWIKYPKKVAKRDAEKAWSARVKDKSLVPAEVMTAMENYVKACAGKSMEYVMHPATFLGPSMRWKDYLATSPKFVPSSVANDDLAWTCGECGAKYRSTAATCAKCGWSRP